MELDLQQTIVRFIWTALSEDIGDGDHTSLACIPHGTKGKAQMIMKENGILAGINIAQQIFEEIDSDLNIEILMQDGQEVHSGDIALRVSGSVHSILKCERLVLNLLQRMSGIATKTNRICKLLEGSITKVLDTRKTSPGLRYFDKLAVKIGGGENHRIGLFDLILIKDNHIDYAGGIKKAIRNSHNYLKEKNIDLKIEIEVRNFEELKEVLDEGGIQRIMLDNFSIEDLIKAVKIIDGRFETEASGGISEEDIVNYKSIGLNFISMGELTHSVKCLDISLKAY